MRFDWLKSHITNGILALVFCFACFSFITQYAGYAVKQKKLDLCRGQERSINHQLKELEEKNAIVEKANRFIENANQSGLTKNKWDLFFVSLKDESLSFSKLETLLTQACNTPRYYFQPESLTIRLARGLVPRINPETAADPASPATGPPQPDITPVPEAGADVQVRLNGYFIAKRDHLDD